MSTMDVEAMQLRLKVARAALAPAKGRGSLFPTYSQDMLSGVFIEMTSDMGVCRNVSFRKSRVAAVPLNAAMMRVSRPLWDNLYIVVRNDSTNEQVGPWPMKVIRGARGALWFPLPWFVVHEMAGRLTSLILSRNDEGSRVQAVLRIAEPM